MSRRASASTRTLLGLAMLNLGTVTAAAQERFYVTQTSPAQIRSFSFDGTAIVEDDAHPSSARTTLVAGTDPVDLLATDRLLLGVSGSGPINLLTIDPITGVEFPRVACCTPTGVGKWAVPSANGQFLYYFGNNATNLTLSILDLRLGSPTLLRPLSVPGTLTLPFPAGTGITRAELDGPSGRIIAAFDQVNAPRVQFMTIDVSSPLAPVLGSVTVAQAPDRGAPGFEVPVSSIRVVENLGQRYVFAARRTLQVYRLESGGALTYLQSIDSASAVAGNRNRTVRDVAFIGTRGYAVTDVQPTETGVEELIVFDLAPGGAALPVIHRSSRVLGTPSNGDTDTVTPTTDGQYLIVLDRGEASASVAGSIRVYLRAAVDSGADGLIASRPIDLNPAQFGTAQGLVLHAPFAQAASGPVVGAVTVPGAAGNVLVNDQPRTIVIQGTNLAGTVNVFVGLVQAAVVSASASTVVATVPPLALAGLAPVLVAGETGTASGVVRIANAADRQAPYLVYSVGFASNQLAQLNAASQTDVTSFWPTGRGPVDPLITADGRFLVSGEFLGNRLLVHSLREDPARNWRRFDVVATPMVGGATQGYAVHPTRPRAYVASLTAQVIATIDLDPTSPAFGTEINRVSTLAPGEAVGAGAGGVRALNVSPDGRHLLAGRSGTPHLMVVNVEDDTPGVAFTVLPGVPAGRSDGLGMHPTLPRLYYSGVADGRVRVYDIASLPAVTEIAQVPIPNAINDVRKTTVAPDGAFAYVSSRGREAIDVIDTATSSLVATIATGPFSSGMSVSPDNAFLFVGVGGTDAVLTVDLRPAVGGSPNPRFRAVVAANVGGVGASGAMVDPGVRTAAGPAQTVAPLPGAAITFAQVTTGGHTTMIVTQAAGRFLPGDFALAGTPLVYDIRTTATVSGPVTVCLPYSGVTEAEEPQLRLLHDEQGSLRDITVSLDTVNDRICGVASSLSAFMIAKYINQATAPSIPRYLAVAVSGSTVDLRWTSPASGGLPGTYGVEADLGSGTFPIRVATASADPRFTTTGVPNGTYRVRIRATNALGTSDVSEAVTFVVGTSTAMPGAPGDLVATASGTTVALAWRPPPAGGAVQAYRISVGSEPGRDDIARLDTAADVTTFGATAVPTGRYFIRVRAVNAAGTGAPSNEALLPVGSLACVVAPPPPVLTGSVSGSTVALSWTAPLGAVSGFQLEAGVAPGVSNAAVVTFPPSTTTFTTIAPAGTYYVRLRALSACGASGASPEVTLHVP